MADRIPSPAAVPSALAQPSTAVDLRPLTTSELIDRGFSLYRAHFAGFFLLALLCQVAPLVIQVIVTAFKLLPTQMDIQTAPQLSYPKLAATLALILVVHVITFSFEVIITFYVSDAYLGKNPSVRESLRNFRSCLISSVWTSLLSLALVTLTFIFPLLALVGPYLYALFYPPTTWFKLITLGLAALVLFVVSMIPVLVVFMRLMVIIPALGLESLNGWAAVRRSATLVRYDPGLGLFYWGEMRLSFLLLPLFVIWMLILSLTSLPQLLFQFGEAVRHGAGIEMAQPPDSVVIISQVLTFLATSLILPLYPIATTLFYYDVRIRREGFDLEFMARQLKEGK